MPKKMIDQGTVNPLLYNREKEGPEEEIIFNKWFMDIFYRTEPGRAFTTILFNKHSFSKLYGIWQRKPRSKKKIQTFISKYHINTSEIDRPLSKYRSFNDFFTRKLKASARQIIKDPDVLISPADSRLIVHTIKYDNVIPIKGNEFTLHELVDNPKIIKPFYDGLCLKFRLAPMDYHRYCYIDDGQHGPIIPVKGVLHSVNPLALNQNLKVLQKNYREFCILDTKHFGSVIHIDIGSLLVGRIHQNLRKGGTFSRGLEKGYFEFGGSTIILLFEPNAITIDKDIIEYSSRGIETLVKYGSAIGKRSRVIR